MLCLGGPGVQIAASSNSPNCSHARPRAGRGRSRLSTRRRAAQNDGDSGSDPSPVQQAQAAPAAKGGSTAEDRLAKALSYREQRRQDDLSMIQQAAARTEKTTPGLRPEMETYLKENREMEVEIISVNKDYKPTVSTWGVFPRPADISAAYGGGRNLKPGQTLETPEQEKARVDRVKNAVGAYRKKIGFDVDVENVEEVRSQLSKGIQLLESGKLEAAATLLREVVELAPLMSEEGGSARLQLAVALDSLSQTDEAKKLYQSLGRHPNIEIVKRANRMLWGMTTAAEFMKADKFQYNRGMREAYARYLNSMTGAWGMYTKEDEEGERQLQIMSWVAVIALIALPVGLLTALKQFSYAH